MVPSMSTAASPEVIGSDNTMSSSAPQATAIVVRPGEGQRVRAFGNEIEFMLSTEQTNGLLSLGLAVAPAGGGPPLHVHSREDELFIIVEGDYEVFADGTWTPAGPGSVVFLPRGQAHTFRVVGNTTGRHWTIATPSGFEQFFVKCSSAFPAAGPPDRAKLATIAEEFGVTFARPAQPSPNVR